MIQQMHNDGVKMQLGTNTYHEDGKRKIRGNFTCKLGQTAMGRHPTATAVSV